MRRTAYPLVFVVVLGLINVCAGKENPYEHLYEYSLAHMSGELPERPSVAEDQNRDAIVHLAASTKSCSKQCSKQCSKSCTTTRGCSSQCKSQTDGCGGWSSGRSWTPSMPSQTIRTTPRSSDSSDVAPRTEVAKPAPAPAPKPTRRIDAGKAFTGVVVTVHDGASITVETEKKERRKIQLAEVHVPAYSTSLGIQSKRALHGLTFLKTVTVKPLAGGATEGTGIAEVYVENVWVNRRMIEDGWASYDVKNSVDDSLAALESKAREARSGHWGRETSQPSGEVPRAVNLLAQPPADDSPELRNWTDVSSNRQISATLVRTVGDKVELKRADGKSGLVPISRLSQADKDYIRRHERLVTP